MSPQCTKVESEHKNVLTQTLNEKGSDFKNMLYCNNYFNKINTSI